MRLRASITRPRQTGTPLTPPRRGDPVAGTQSLLRRLAFALSRGENWRMRNDDVPGFTRKFLLSVHRRAGDARRVALCCMLLAASPAATLAQGPQGGATSPVGI